MAPGETLIPQVCRDLDLSESAVRRWISLFAQSGGGSPMSHEAESEELRGLRTESRLVKQERGILIKAALGSTAQRNTSLSICAGVA